MVFERDVFIKVFSWASDFSVYKPPVPEWLTLAFVGELPWRSLSSSFLCIPGRAPQEDSDESGEAGSQSSSGHDLMGIF